MFNNSLENSKIFADLKEKNKVLDEKIFNLFAINQSKKAFIMLKKEANYAVLSSIGIPSSDHEIIINNQWTDALTGECIYDFKATSPQLYFNDQGVTWLGSTNCTVIAPIHIDKASLGAASLPMGYLVVVETNESLQDDEVLLIDTISKNISPVIYHMNTIKELKSNYIEEPKKAFLSVLDEKIKDCHAYEVDFNLYYRIIKQHPFESVIIPELEGADYNKVDNYVIVITYDNLDEHDFKKLPMPNSIKDFLSYDYQD